jgi:cell division protein FtsZ
VDDNLEDEISITLIATGFNRPVVTKHDLHEVRNLYTPPQEQKVETITEVQMVVEPVGQQTLIEELVRLTPEVSAVNTSSTLFNDSSIEKTDKTPEKSIQNPEPLEIRTFFRQEPEFEIVNPVIKPEGQTPVYVHTPVEKPGIEQEDQRMDRINKLKSLSHKTLSPSNVEEMERVPAYMRRNVDLPESGQASDSNVSRYTLGTDSNNKTGLRENNSFLHDNVD